MNIILMLLQMFWNYIGVFIVLIAVFIIYLNRRHILPEAQGRSMESMISSNSPSQSSSNDSAGIHIGGDLDNSTAIAGDVCIKRRLQGFNGDDCTNDEKDSDNAETRAEENEVPSSSGIHIRGDLDNSTEISGDVNIQSAIHGIGSGASLSTTPPMASSQNVTKMGGSELPSSSGIHIGGDLDNSTEISGDVNIQSAIHGIGPGATVSHTPPKTSSQNVTKIEASDNQIIRVGPKSDNPKAVENENDSEEVDDNNSTSIQSGIDVSTTVFVNSKEGADNKKSDLATDRHVDNSVSIKSGIDASNHIIFDAPEETEEEADGSQSPQITRGVDTATYVYNGDVEILSTNELSSPELAALLSDLTTDEDDSLEGPQTVIDRSTPKTSITGKMHSQEYYLNAETSQKYPYLVFVYDLAEEASEEYIRNIFNGLKVSQVHKIDKVVIKNAVCSAFVEFEDYTSLEKSFEYDQSVRVSSVSFDKDYERNDYYKVELDDSSVPTYYDRVHSVRMTHDRQVHRMTSFEFLTPTLLEDLE